MEIQAQESAFERAHIPEGIHNAELVAVQPAPDGQYGPRVALDFNVYYSKKEGPARIGRVFGKKLTPKSMLWEALNALGAKLSVGDKVDTDSLLQNPCRVVVEDYTDNDGNTVSGISKVKAPDDKTAAYLTDAKQQLRKIKEGVEHDPVPVEEIADTK